MRLLATAILFTSLHTGPLWAQHDHTGSPYAGQQTSEIPSLTPEELAGLRLGEGMGMAKPAELNHYPGPMHVLELADDLHLTQEQRAKVDAIRETMSNAARRIGKQIIEAEATLNTRFAHDHIDAETLEESVAQIAGLYGELRFVHLVAHLGTKAILTADQVATYDRLRGYASDSEEQDSLP